MQDRALSAHMASTCPLSLSARTALCGRPLATRSATPASCTGRSSVTVQCKESRIGKQPVAIPNGVTYTLDGRTISVKGPKGALEYTYPEVLELKEENGCLRFYKREESRKANECHGLARALTSNMVVGTSAGFTRVLSLIGVGYRASVASKQLTMNLGYSNPVVLDIPAGIEVSVDKLTTVTVGGFDKSAVGQFAALIRSKRPPEPYKGKGVRYVDEVVRKKEGKRGK